MKYAGKEVRVIRKRFFVAGFLFVFLMAMGGCKCETSTSFGLSIDNASFARMGEKGKLSLINDIVYKKGETIYFVLLNVGKFKKGEDGLNRFDMDMEFMNPEGAVILSRKGMLGKKGHVNLPDNIAESPYAIVNTTTKLKSGKHTIKITIYDKVGGGSASKGSTVTIE